MRTTVTRAEIEGYRENGFLAMPDFLDSHELAHWREAVAAAARARIERPDGLSNALDDDYYRAVFTQLSGLRRLSREVEALVLDARIGELAARLAGVEAVRLWNDQALFKPPFGNPTAWHFDMPKWSFDDRRAITIWVALDAATVENGCMWYLPGSHLTARLDDVRLGSNLGALFDLYPEWRSRHTVAAVLPPGGAVWHNGLTAHAAGANMTSRPRDAMTCAYMPAEVHYNGRRDDYVLPEDYAASLSVGDPLDDPQLFPIVA
jgi:ectoine hydroxylase-related dioxygenase (phytanoyl-CoA dioxygenase family)